MERKLIYLSKLVSHALRHEPWMYELELDEQGWVPIEELIYSLKQLNTIWKDLTKEDFCRMIEVSEKKRYEIYNNKIRALYGHSIPNKLIKQPAIPPDILYHGTTPENLQEIKSHGLLPMSRQYVHLSADIATAEQVGKRKSKNPVILIIKSKEAYQNNIPFYQGNDLVWLADKIPIEFIHFS